HVARPAASFWPTAHLAICYATTGHARSKSWKSVERSDSGQLSVARPSIVANRKIPPRDVHDVHSTFAFSSLGGELVCFSTCSRSSRCSLCSPRKQSLVAGSWFPSLNLSLSKNNPVRMRKQSRPWIAQEAVFPCYRK